LDTVVRGSFGLSFSLSIISLAGRRDTVGESDLPMIPMPRKVRFMFVVKDGRR
jgi:hypothetical protein